jgi:hypothetical protein
MNKHSVTASIGPVAGLIAVAIVSAALTYIAVLNRGFTFSVNKNGNVEVKVSASDSFAEIFKKAIGADPKIVDAVLASENYYKLTDVKLVDALENLDSAQNQEIAKRLRIMLLDLRGPFSLPGTLRDATDGRFVRALDDLDNAPPDAKEANALLAELWKRYIDQEGIFKFRSFKATVELVPNASTGDENYKVVLACPGSAVAIGRLMSLSSKQDTKTIIGEINQDASLFDCDGKVLTVEQLLSGQATVQLGVSETTFKQLAIPAEIDNKKIDAKFYLYPKNLVARF